MCSVTQLCAHPCDEHESFLIDVPNVPDLDLSYTSEHACQSTSGTLPGRDFVPELHSGEIPMIKL